MIDQDFECIIDVKENTIGLIGAINRHRWSLLIEKVFNAITHIQVSNDNVQQKLIFDLSQVKEVDSSALAFFLAIQRRLQSKVSTKNCTIQLNHTPAALRQLGVLYRLCV